MSRARQTYRYVDRPWTRKGPDLWYAGSKFNADWLVAWLQNPKAIRPDGYPYFKTIMNGPDHDVSDRSKITPHAKLDKAAAETAAAALMQLKAPADLLPPGTFKGDTAGARMGKLSFNKLRGCVACHQGEDGKGGFFRSRTHRCRCSTAAPRPTPPIRSASTAYLDADADAQRSGYPTADRIPLATWPRRQSMKTQLVLTLAAAALLLTPTVGRADPPAKQLYETYCVQCHGLKRNGSGVNLPGLSVRPRDHTDSKGMGATPDDELFKAIKESGLAVNKSV